MAHQKDYILRLIEQAGQMLIELRNRLLSRDGSRVDVDTELHRASAKAGLDLELVRAATPETLLMIVAPTGEVEPGRCWILAEMLYVDGLHAQLEERKTDAIISFDKAIRLFRLLEPGGAFLTGLREAASRVEEVEARLQELTEGGSPNA